MWGMPIEVFIGLLILISHLLVAEVTILIYSKVRKPDPAIYIDSKPTTLQVPRMAAAMQVLIDSHPEKECLALLEAKEALNVFLMDRVRLEGYLMMDRRTRAHQ